MLSLLLPLMWALVLPLLALPLPWWLALEMLLPPRSPGRLQPA
jgi:hypothetical protein